MGLEADIRQFRERQIKKGTPPVPEAFNRVTKDKVREVLNTVSRGTDDMADAVYVFLDNRISWFSEAAMRGWKFSDGATTAHVVAHVGILQRGPLNKLDRQGRHYWLKPLCTA